MKKIPDNFIQALKQKDNNALNNALKFMLYETKWAIKDVYSKRELEEGYGWGYQDYGTSDWTPLAEAAYLQNEAAIEIIFARWPNHAVDLLSRTLRALNHAEHSLQTYPANKDCKHLLTHTNLTQAKIFLRYHYTTLIPSFQFPYNATDSNAYAEFLLKKIDELEDVSSLITFYETYITKNCLHYQRGFCFSKPSRTYSNASIYLITHLHEKIYQLMKNQGDMISIENGQDLMRSTIFSDKHYQAGVLTQPIRNLIHEQLINAPLPDATLPVAIAIIDDSFVAFEPSNSPEATYFSTIYKILHCMVGTIAGLAYSLLTYFTGQCDSSPNDLYIPHKGL